MLEMVRHLIGMGGMIIPVHDGVTQQLLQSSQRIIRATYFGECRRNVGFDADMGFEQGFQLGDQFW